MKISEDMYRSQNDPLEELINAIANNELATDYFFGKNGSIVSLAFQSLAVFSLLNVISSSKKHFSKKTNKKKKLTIIQNSTGLCIIWAQLQLHSYCESAVNLLI